MKKVALMQNKIDIMSKKHRNLLKKVNNLNSTIKYLSGEYNKMETTMAILKHDTLSSDTRALIYIDINMMRDKVARLRGDVEVLKSLKLTEISKKNKKDI